MEISNETWERTQGELARANAYREYASELIEALERQLLERDSEINFLNEICNQFVARYDKINNVLTWLVAWMHRRGLSNTAQWQMTPARNLLADIGYTPGLLRKLNE